MYINRDLADCIIKASKSFKVIILTGARQVGKSTMLREIGTDREYVTLDDYEQRALAVEDPKGFLSVHKPPVTIDEIQYAPKLLSYIKMDVDNSDENGRYWLTGSQHFSLMKNVSESLAGRAAVFSMHPLSLQESLGQRQQPFCPGSYYRDGLAANMEKSVLRGCLPLCKEVFTHSSGKMTLPILVYAAILQVGRMRRCLRKVHLQERLWKHTQLLKY